MLLMALNVYAAFAGLFPKDNPYTQMIAVMLLVSLAAPVFAQSTRIEGCVYDASSGDPLPYANIFLESTFL